MAPTETCAFLHQLPAEMRNQIYKQTLKESVPIDISSVAHPLTKTGSQIRQESLGIYYSENTFQATVFESIVKCFADIKHWLINNVGPNCCHLRKLSIVIAAPEGLYGVSRYKQGWNPWAWLERTLFEVGCSHKLLCEVSFEGLGSAEPHLRPPLWGSPVLPDCINVHMINYYQKNFDGVLDRSAPNLASFKTIALYELAEMSPAGFQWLRKQLREFSAILQESRAAMTRFAAAQTLARILSLRHFSNRGEHEGKVHDGDHHEGDHEDRDD